MARARTRARARGRVVGRAPLAALCAANTVTSTQKRASVRLILAGTQPDTSAFADRISDSCLAVRFWGKRGSRRAQRDNASRSDFTSLRTADFTAPTASST